MKQNILTISSQEEPVTIDKLAIKETVTLIVSAAQKCQEETKLIFVGYGEDPDGDELKPLVKQYLTNFETQKLITKICHDIEDMSAVENRNIYAPLAAMRPDLPKNKKGGKKDIKYVLGFVADFDDKDAGQYMNRLPLPPDFVLETSAGRFQAFFLFKDPVMPEIANHVAVRLKEYANCDHGTKDISHVWRIAGTLNWPNKKKVTEGRPRQPQLVKFVQIKDQTYGK